MNEKFYKLPKEKQQAIINAGFKVFSRNSYKKSPVGEIAEYAGISKSLLFHYFHNKKELYLFLWKKCCELTIESLKEYNCYEKKGFFEMMEVGLKCKMNLMRKYPDIGRFSLNAYYEDDPLVYSEIQNDYRKYKEVNAYSVLANLDPRQFKEGMDLEMMIKDMFYASDGYLSEALRSNQVDVDKIEEDFSKMVAFWKKIYSRNGD